LPLAAGTTGLRVQPAASPARYRRPRRQAFAQLLQALARVALVHGFGQSLSMLALAVLLMCGSDVRFRGLVMGYVGLGLALVAAIALTWRAVLLPSHAPANATR